MNTFFRQQKTNTLLPGHILSSMQTVNDILNWLGGLIWLTEEEQNEAGIYFGDPI